MFLWGQPSGHLQLRFMLPRLQQPPHLRKSLVRSAIGTTKKGKQAVAETLAFFKEQHVPAYQKIIENPDPAETIIQEAQRGNYDLIVLGYSGHEEDEPHLGSIAVKVSRHAHTPVLIARERRRIRKILVPVDGSESAERALRSAATVAKKTNAKITLLYVQESSIHKLKPEIARGIGTNILARAADLAKEAKLDQKLESGDPAKVIIQTAKNGDYDLIVIGNKGHSTISRFLLGSVSDHVIHYTDRSVLLVR